MRDNASGPGYLARLVPEVILLWCLAYHRSVLVRMGKWHVDGRRLQEYASRRRNTIARDKRFLIQVWQYEKTRVHIFALGVEML